MKKRQKRSKDQKKNAMIKKPADLQGAGGDNCRCKEISKKTVPDMLRLMLNDLSFWKRKK